MARSSDGETAASAVEYAIWHRDESPAALASIRCNESTSLLVTQDHNSTRREYDASSANNDPHVSGAIGHAHFHPDPTCCRFWPHRCRRVPDSGSTILVAIRQAALALAYRHLDTAAMYETRTAVVAAAGSPPQERVAARNTARTKPIEFGTTQA